MKIGIFGDSFAVHYPWQQPRTAWANVLEDKFKWNVTNYAWGATSLFWTYKQLLSKINDVDIVILAITQRGRLYIPNPQLSPSGLGTFGTVSNRIANIDKNHSEYEIFNAAYQYFVHLSNDDFDEYVHSKLVDDIKKVCLDQNKRLILIPGFDEDVSSQDIFQMPLVHVSAAECHANFKKHYVKEVPTRTCHMTDENNSILADFMDQILRGARTTVELREFNFDKLSDPSSQWDLTL